MAANPESIKGRMTRLTMPVLKVKISCLQTLFISPFNAYVPVES
jgi:hypothetical protein